jgi:hypothetical protein
MESLLTLFAPMLLGAQLILTLVLTKGEICPGQRGRVHKLLPALGLLWLAIVSTNIEAFVIASAIFYFFSQVQTKKTRDKGPLWVLFIANGLATVFVVMQIINLNTLSSALSWGFVVVLLGGIFANLLLLIARSRLQAFHSILPIIGILSGISLAILIAVQALTLSDSLMALMQSNILIGLALLVVGLLMWSVHLVLNRTVNRVQLSVAFSCLLLSTWALTPLFNL